MFNELTCCLLNAIKSLKLVEVRSTIYNVIYALEIESTDFELIGCEWWPSLPYLGIFYQI